MNCGKTAEGVEMPFGMETRVDQRHIVLDGGPGPNTMRQFLRPTYMPSFISVFAVVHSCGRQTDC